MNKGIRSYLKMLPSFISNDTKSLININKEDFNLHIIVNLYTSKGQKSLPLSLIYTLSDRDKNVGFGNGFKLNFYNKLKVNKNINPNNIIETKSDGSLVEYNRIGESNYYKNDELHTQIYDDWNIHEVENSCLILTDSYLNKYTYDYHYLSYPQKLEMANGFTYHFNIDSTKIYEIDNNDGEKIEFEYSTLATNIIVKIDNIQIYKIELCFDSNQNITNIKKYKGNNLISQTNFDFDFNSNEKYIKIMDQISNKRVFYSLDGDFKVFECKSDYDETYSSGKSVLISYFNNYSKIIDSLGKENTFFFDNEGKLLYSVDSEIRVQNYVYNENKELIKQSCPICNDKAYVISKNESLFNDGFFVYGVGEWETEGIGYINLINDSSNPIVALGNKALKLNCESNQFISRQNINIAGNPNEHLSFVFWSKIISSVPNDSNCDVSIRIIVQSNGANILRKTISIDKNLNIWQYKTLGLKVDKSYTNVIIELILKGNNTQVLFNGLQLYKKNIGGFQDYDSNGNILKQSNGNNSSNNEYNNENNISFNSGWNLESLSYLYDNRNNPIHVSLPYGAKIVREYDDKNRIINEKTIAKDLYMEKVNQYDVPTNESNILKNINYNYSGVATETYFNELYHTISKIKLPSNIEKELYYDNFENLIKVLVKKDNNTTNIEYEYDEKNLLTKIKLPSYSYKIVYDANNRPLKIIYECGINNSNLIEVNYLTKQHNNVNVKTNLVEKEKFGENGDILSFSYNDQNKIDTINLIKRNTITEIPQFAFEYNKYGKVTKITNLDFNPNLVTNLEYDLNNNLIKLYDNEENSINYYYNLENTVNTKVYNNNNIINAFSKNSVDRSKGITSETLFDGLMRDGKYVCCFNQYKKEDSNIIISKNLCKKEYNSNNENSSLVMITPTKGNDLNPVIEDGFGTIEYLNDSSERLQYVVNAYSGFEYPNGSFMFWFKIDQYQNGKCLISFGENELKNQIYVMFESNSLALYVVDDNGTNYKLISEVGNIILNQWNYIGIAFHNRYDGQGFRDLCKYYLQLNGVQKEYIKLDPRLYVELSVNCPVGIGCKISGSSQNLKFNGSISALMFGQGLYSGDNLDWYYRLCKEYVFKKLYTDTNKKTLYSSSVDKYNISDDGNNLLSNYKVIPLHNSLTTLNGDNPLKYTERATVYYDKDKQFNFDEQCKRYVYVCDGQQLIYNSYNENNSDSGVITLKVKMSDSIYNNYILQCKDSNGKTLGLFRKVSNNKLYIELNGTEIYTGLIINDTNWHFIGLTWSKVVSSSSMATYAYSLRLALDDVIVNTSRDVNFTYTNLLISLGRQFDYNAGTCLPLYGNIEMVLIGENYVSSNTLSILKQKSEVFSISKHYNNFGLLELISYSKDITSKARIEYKYVKQNNKLSTLIDEEKIITSNRELNNKYVYDLNDKLIEIKKSNIINRKYEYNYLGYLVKDEIKSLNKKFTYDYDNIGNIISKKEFLYGSTTLIKNNIYQYSDDYPTLLTSYDNKIIEYNDTLFGNPTSYGTGNNKYIYQWQGKKLIVISNLSKSLDMYCSYNNKGLRIRKIVDNIETKYFYEGKNLVYETNPYIDKYYYYDESDTIIGFGLKEQNDIQNYYFIRDINGIITSLINDNGNLVVEYEYDAFGKILSITGAEASTIGTINNILYKGYYYDFETEMYYLKSRYYIPEWGRFLNSDDPRLLANYSYLNINRNIFSYCNNDPIQNMDENGQSFKTFLRKVWEVIKFLSPVEVNTSKSIEIRTGNSYVTTTKSQKIIGNSWSKISIDIGVNKKGEKTWNIGLGGPISFNFGSGGVSFKIEGIGYNESYEASFGLTNNGNLFGEVGKIMEPLNEFSITTTVGTEVEIDWQKLAYEFQEVGQVIFVAGAIVGLAWYVAPIFLTSSFGLALSGSFAPALLLVMIP